MAKSLLSITMKAIKDAERARIRDIKAVERAQRAAEREQNAAIRESLRAARAEEARLKKNAVANERARKEHEKALKAAHVASQLAEVENLNAQIADTFEELEGLLNATIDVDDYIDLPLLRRSEDTFPFDMPELEIALPAPAKLELTAEPSYIPPAQPKGLFGKKKKLAAAQIKAQQAFEEQKAKWDADVQAAQSKYDAEILAHTKSEEQRTTKLAAEKERFRVELDEHNQTIDKFISDLSYGDAEAVKEYIAMVVENSNYPDHFPVTHEFSFDPALAELRMQVALPSPSKFPAVKAYKYVKSSDEIRETPLSKTELKNRYFSTIYQVSVRSIHEVFEADRRGLIKTISLEVGTKDSDPATGKKGFLPFVGVSAEKNSFMEFDLSNVQPLATLKHLGAAITKDPINLVVVDVSGVRKS